MNILTRCKLREIVASIIKEEDEQRMSASGEVVSGNNYKRDNYNSTASGLRIAINIIEEELKE